jgi:hypothetical protein
VQASVDTPSFWKDILEMGECFICQVDRQLFAGVYMNKSVMQKKRKKKKKKKKFFDVTFCKMR